MKHLLILFLVLFPACCHSKMSIGMNLYGVTYYSPHAFTDLAKSSGVYGWGPSWGYNDQGTFDENGYPTVVPQNIGGSDLTFVMLLNVNVKGDYVMLYDGVGTFAAASPGINITSTQPGKVYMTLTGYDGAGGISFLTSQQGNHVRNLRIIPVEYESNEAAMPTFDPGFVRGLQPFSCIRFMDFTQTNFSPQSLWADRVKTTELGQGKAGFYGVAWEYVIELGNTLNQDIWINIPHMATDNYIKQLATLIKNNLNPNLKVWVEYSNEVWNWAFAQSHWLIKEKAAGHPDSYIHDDLVAIENGQLYGHMGEKVAYMSARCFRLFREVFGDEMSSRVVRVASVWTAGDYYSDQLVTYLFDTLKEGADVLSPTSYFGLATEAYSELDAKEVANPGSVTVADVLQKAEEYMTVENGFTDNMGAIAKKFGIPIATYEGGQHIDWRHDTVDSDGDGDPHNDPEEGWRQEMYDAHIAPGMYNLYMNRMQNNVDNGCILWMAYNYVGKRESIHGSWGHLESYDQLDLDQNALKIAAPKYAALLSPLLTEPVSIKWGYLHPKGKYVLRSFDM